MSSNVGLQLQRIAAVSGWECVTEYAEATLWVIDLKANASLQLESFATAGLMLATIDVIAVEQIVSTQDFSVMFLKVNAEAHRTDGLYFSMTPDASHILLNAPFHAGLSDEELSSSLEAFSKRAADWAEVLSAPTENETAGFIPETYIRA